MRQTTLLETLRASLRTSMLVPDGMAVPAAILWTDADGQWAPLLDSLRTLCPYIYALGAYQPESRTGPAIWLKCIVDRTLPEAPPEGKIPILYLPRVRRQDLRAAAECPPGLEPLVELQYRGRVWHQANGHDWTARAFLMSDVGLGLDVAGDRRTEEAMLRALPLLADVNTRTLKGRLDADDFDKLSVADPVRDLLLWLHQPPAFETATKGARWESFRSVCQSEFALDPEDVSPAQVAGRLLVGERNLDRVWARFAEAPNLYSGLARLLREPAGVAQGAAPPESGRDPQINEREENETRKELESLVNLPHASACARLLELDVRQQARRAWVWASLGWSPWAMALGPLARLAKAAQTPIGGTTLAAAAASYAERGWECDAAAMEALSSFRGGADAALMSRVARTLYGPWLDTSARHFQSLAIADPAALKADATAARTAEAEKDVCIVFVDGLRFDIAARLAAVLEGQGLRVVLSHRLAPLPTVTATAKTAVAPIPDEIQGGDGIDFAPLIQSRSGLKPVTAALLRERLESAGVNVITADEPRIAAGAAGWTECGAIDTLGHSLQGDLVYQLNAEVEKITARIASLLAAGWARIRVVTDHGWLLLPGGLPKVDLPSYLAETKWSRCALVKGQPDLSVPVAPWYWNPAVRIASPPGMACFRAGETYAHGGISPQECVTPELLVERGAVTAIASIRSVEWRGMRCRVRVETNDPRVMVDLRTNWKQPASSIVAASKEIALSGEVSLAVSDDAHEGASAAVVVIDADGRILANENTCVGEQS